LSRGDTGQVGVSLIPFPFAADLPDLGTREGSEVTLGCNSGVVAPERAFCNAAAVGGALDDDVKDG
jgi:hypothetical protein